MKILFVGSWQGWMGLHLRHFSAAFAFAGHEVFYADYTVMRQFAGLRIRAFEQELLDRRLEKQVRKHCPDLILFAASWKFDLRRLRTYYRGLIVVYDYDGPRRRDVQDFLSAGPVDLWLTVSRWTERNLLANGCPCRYLPHGVDTDYYAPGEVSESERRQFGANVSYIGRATDRRAELCSQIADAGLALYGDRWRQYPSCDRYDRLRRNVSDRELVSIYRASTAVLNILQEPLDQYRTILSLQCFAVPASGGCLIAERVEEFSEAFEEGKEVLTFGDPEEFRAQIERVLRDPAEARRVGEAGRIRCLACHTHRHRVEELLGMLR